jgi:hypothetical protein
MSCRISNCGKSFLKQFPTIQRVMGSIKPEWLKNTFKMEFKNRLNAI